MEDWKIKISVLWIALGILCVWGPFSEFFLPGNIEEIISGYNDGDLITPEMLLVLTVLTIIPLVMAVLSLTLRDKANRWANIIMGVVFAVAGLIDPIVYVTERPAYSAFMILIGIVVVVFSALIVWYAWKSKQKT